MKGYRAAVLLLAMSSWLGSAVPSLAMAKLKPTRESCGWAIAVGDTLEFRPDPSLTPLKDKLPLPTAPEGAQAVYCDRDSIVSAVSDVRLLTELRLPLIIREGDRVGVSDYEPEIVFGYEIDEKGRWTRLVRPSPQCADPSGTCAGDPKP